MGRVAGKLSGRTRLRVQALMGVMLQNRMRRVEVIAAVRGMASNGNMLFSPCPSERQLDRLISIAHKQLEAEGRASRDVEYRVAVEQLRTLQRMAMDAGEIAAAIKARKELSELLGLKAPEEQDDVTITVALGHEPSAEEKVEPVNSVAV